MADAAFSHKEIISLLVKLTLVSAVTFISIKWLMNQVDPTNKSKKARKKAEEQLKRLAGSGHTPLVIKNLSDYEIMKAANLIYPQDITVSWGNIAGLDNMIQELRETVILPIRRKELFADSQLTTAPKALQAAARLIAKATAKEAWIRFINLNLSILTHKWYGESQKLAAVVFSLAVKLQPCIVFIDEIDSFLRSRNTTDHEATAMVKAQFMSLWDGLITDLSCTVIVMGATNTTNRPQDLDRAILRRMSASFHIPMPNALQRKRILTLTLENKPVAEDVDVDRLARQTDGFSGSDLRELCRNGSVYRDEYHDALRPITMEDLMTSLHKMRESKIHWGSLLMNAIQLD
ncbi:AAA domain containing protein [Asbolus verrucosus]|uniref:AAA domain containing protein n=1 Tax=Asbolus verrucosus TaxID=1661398 RepID=A0A482VT56_ASBVE|nr:AAA domain containing protein [Asbolus verrucosus]